MDYQKKIHQHVTHEDSDYYHLQAKRSPLGGAEKPHILFPHSILDDVSSKEDIQRYLDKYQHQTGWKSLCPDSHFARRWYVEKIRPAMRFYCQKYSVPIPAWLNTDEYFLKMAPTTKYSNFGPDELRPIVFKKLDMRPKQDEEKG